MLVICRMERSQMSDRDEENVKTNVYVWLKTHSAVGFGRRRLAVSFTSSGIPAIRTHNILESEESSHASQAPPSASCLFIRLLLPLLPQSQCTLTDCVTQGDVEITHSRLLSSERSLMRLLHSEAAVYCSAPQNSPQMSWHQWAHQFIHSGPEKPGGQFLMAYWTQHWYGEPVGNFPALPHVRWFKYVNHTSSVLLISNIITPHLSLYVRKTAILSEFFSFPFDRNFYKKKKNIPLQRDYI